MTTPSSRATTVTRTIQVPLTGQALLVDEPAVDLPVGTLEQRRRATLLDAAAEVWRALPAPGPVVAARLFADGCLAAALGGDFDLPAVERLDALLGEFRQVAVSELVLDLGGVGVHPPRFSRVVGHARIRCLVDAVRIELHRLPASLQEALDLYGGPGCAADG